MNSTIDYLPRSMAEIAQHIGVPATLRLVDAYGGTPVYVPTPERLHDDHPLCAVLGYQAAHKLAELIQVGDTIEVPLCRGHAHALRHADIVAQTIAGRSEREIARAYRVTGRAVRYHRAQARAEGELNAHQGQLFDER